MFFMLIFVTFLANFITFFGVFWSFFDPFSCHQSGSKVGEFTFLHIKTSCKKSDFNRSTCHFRPLKMTHFYSFFDHFLTRFCVIKAGQKSVNSRFYTWWSCVKRVTFNRSNCNLFGMTPGLKHGVVDPRLPINRP